MNENSGKTSKPIINAVLEIYLVCNMFVDCQINKLLPNGTNCNFKSDSNASHIFFTITAVCTNYQMEELHQ